MNRTFWPSVFLICCVFFFFEFTDMDIWIQDRFYNFQTHTWLVDETSPIPRLLFYTMPKALVWIIALTLLGAAIFHEKLGFLKIPRRNLIIAVLTIATAPALVALGKATTNTFTPAQTRRYGGDVPYVKVIQHFPKNDTPAKRGRAFPAGHASGGFALLALAELAFTRRGRAIAIATGLTFGTVMGLYQMMKGAHYLSHTLFTAIFCWIVFLSYRRIILTSHFKFNIHRSLPCEY